MLMLTGAIIFERLLAVVEFAVPILLIWTMVSLVVALAWTFGILRCRLLTRCKPIWTVPRHGHFAMGGSDINTASGL